MTLYHPPAADSEAESAFDRVFRQGGIPEDVPVFDVSPDPDPKYLPGVLVELGLVTSTSEGRRMLEQGAVRIDGERFSDQEIAWNQLAGTVVQVGKRRFAKVAGGS